MKYEMKLEFSKKEDVESFFNGGLDLFHKTKPTISCDKETQKIINGLGEPMSEEDANKFFAINFGN